MAKKAYKSPTTKALDPLALLRLIVRTIDSDELLAPLAQDLLAEVEHLQEVEIAALQLADMVTADEKVIALPTADSPLIKTIRGQT